MKTPIFGYSPDQKQASVLVGGAVIAHDDGSGSVLPVTPDAPLPVAERSDWLSISVGGKVADATKTISMTFGDGTTQEIYFDSDGEFAGRSERA